LIDFRYHLVSIISVFLALAVGIVVGTTALNGVIVDDLRQRVDGLAADKRAREQTITEQQRTLAGANGFANAITPQEVGGALNGRRIALISAPGVDAGVRSDVQSVLEQAGATLTTRIRLGDAFADANRQADVSAVATDAARVQGVSLDGQSTTAQRVAESLGSAVAGTGDGGAGGNLGSPAAIAAQRRALDPWRSAGLVTVDQQNGPGDVVLVLVPDPPDPRPDKDVLTPQVIALASSLDARDDGTVVAGSVDSADSGVLAAVRNADGLGSKVSTQDSVETPWGRISLVRTTRAEASGTAGQYGVGPGSRGPLPVPSSK
jgi:hypothetical protein